MRASRFVGAATAVLCLSAGRAAANDIQFYETVFATDYVSAGLGGIRGLGFGEIDLSGVTGPVTKAYLYWHCPERHPYDYSTAPQNTNIWVNGDQVVGTPIGRSDPNCWSFKLSWGYRADVTSLVAGDGTYSIAGLGNRLYNGPGSNGVSLIVFFDDGDSTNNRDVVIFDGNDSNIFNPYDAPGWNVTLPGIDYTSGSANMQLHVGDGQAWTDGALVVNGTVIASAGAIFQGNSVPGTDADGPTGNGNLWDIKDFDVTSFMSPGLNTLQLTTDAYSDCLSLVVALVDLPVGSAPQQPDPPNTAPSCMVEFGGVVPGIDGVLDLTVNANELLEINLRGEDIDVGDSLTLTATGLPMAATLTPASGTTGSSPLEAVFSWTPTDLDAPGPHHIEFTYTDLAGEVSTCVLEITVNRIPICVVSGGEVVAGMLRITEECTSPAGALVTIDGSASHDPDGDDLFYTWFVTDANVVLDETIPETVLGVFPVGVTMVTLTVADGRGGVDMCDVWVTVEDTTPPEVACTTDTAMLWPPNHGLVTVTLTLMATDTCTDPQYIWPLTCVVSSDEPDDGQGDGSTTGDVNVNGVGMDAFAAPIALNPVPTGVSGEFIVTVQLRAERDGAMDGRKYTFNVSALDPAGNETITSCCVVVPHDMRGRNH